MELKEMTENCDTFERQNTKLHHDLNLALEKLEEMTEEAERFAQESLNSQKKLADSEQKREEFQIQAQETMKQYECLFFSFSLKHFHLDGMHVSKSSRKISIDTNSIQHKWPKNTNNLPKKTKVSNHKILLSKNKIPNFKPI